MLGHDYWHERGKHICIWTKLLDVIYMFEMLSWGMDLKKSDLEIIL